MSGLSHGVVRVDQDNSLTSLTLQDCGQVTSAALGPYRLASLKNFLSCSHSQLGNIILIV